jgi:hypothetical protein
MTATASSTTTNRIEKTAAFFIARTIVMYHAGGSGENEIYRRKATGCAEWKDQIQL